MSDAQAGGTTLAGEALLADLGAGVKLLTGMLGLTVALLPPGDRAFVLNALAALQADSGRRETVGPAPQLAAHASAEAARALSVLIERFALEVAAARAGGTSAALA